MSQVTRPEPVSARRVVSLVISDDTDPRAILAELLNSLEEDEERAAIEFLCSPDVALFLACREIEMERVDEDA